MFFLSELENDIKVLPDTQQIDFMQVLEKEINRIYANKVVLNLGLVICLYEIVKIDKSFVIPVLGGSVTKVRFTVIVFRPSLGSLISGKIKNCSIEGIQVSLGFFEDIFVPAKNLQYPSRFNNMEQSWIWEYHIGNGITHNLILDAGEEIQLRVVSDDFKENEPLPDKTLLMMGNQKPVPYSITGNMNEPGLGALSWWTE